MTTSPDLDPRGSGGSALVAPLHTFESAISALAWGAIVLLPIVEALLRLFGGGIDGSIDYVRHLTLWIGFLGAMLAAREGRHLSLSLPPFGGEKVARWRAVIGAGAGAAISLLLAKASVDLVIADREVASDLGGLIPVWLAEMVMPVGFLVVGLRLWWHAGGMVPRLVAGALALAPFALTFVPEMSRPSLVVPGLVALGVAALFGAPIFAVLGGAALVLFFADLTPLAAIPAEAYRIATNPILPAIPLFTLTGVLLAEGKASDRLMRLFRASLGFAPGGSALAAVAACAFFTTFNGGSGVTILALGGLMLPVLIKERYGERFSLGLVTASGSLGILFPPSLVIILYGVTAQTPIDRLFAAGLLPGILFVLLIGGLAVRRGILSGAERTPASLTEAARALWAAKWEAVIPIAVVGGIFSGKATLNEIAAYAALYVVVVELLVHRDVGLRRLGRAVTESGVLVGGILIILAAAMGLNSYLVYADVPTRGADWVQSGIESRWVFLLALNLFLLLVGCLMDIFSAIVVVVPLILPVALAFGVDPVHLGIIFLANMELGYLTPPVGMNLFLSSMRFKKPLVEVYRSTLPLFLALLVGVLVVTYVPWLTVGFADLIGF